MANVKWSGIEAKYNLTARWYVSAQYGSDTDDDAVGDYNPSTNVTGWGGPTRPFKSVQKLGDYSSIAVNSICIVDSGKYETSSAKVLYLVGDGNVILTPTIGIGAASYYNLTLLNFSNTQGSIVRRWVDCVFVYCLNLSSNSTGCTIKNTIFIECTMGGTWRTLGENLVFIRCSGLTLATSNQSLLNSIIINSPDLTLGFSVPRPTGVIRDYSIIIGTVKTAVAINGKTVGVTIEDFKADGNYFGKSFSEVDLWGNTEGSGATTTQLQEIFNNYFSPVYLDNWQYLDLSLKSDVNDKIRYGGLDGHFIGAKAVGYAYGITALWASYQDAGNTSNVEIDSVSGNLILSAEQTTGKFTSTEITLGATIVADLSMFFKNNIFNSAGVAVQRLDYTDDVAKSNTVNQRTVYSYRLKTSPDTGTALGVWKEYELDRAPTVDANGYSNMDDLFDVDTEVKQTIRKFAIEITLRNLT